jgi:Flp pilus assembly protein TadG
MASKVLAVDRRNERGTAMVELTFALPLLVVMLFGVMEFGRLFVEWQIVQSSARSGARSASLYRAQCTPDAVRKEVTATVNAVLSANPLTKARTLAVEVSNPCSTQASQLCCVTVRLHTDLGVLQSIVEIVSGKPNVILASTAVRRPEAAVGVSGGLASCAAGI